MMINSFSLDFQHATGQISLSPLPTEIREKSLCVFTCVRVCVMREREREREKERKRERNRETEKQRERERFKCLKDFVLF
jgi:hypothetical protein